MEVKVVQVVAPPKCKEVFVVIVPDEYEDCATNIDQVARALGRKELATWVVVRECDVKHVELG